MRKEKFWNVPNTVTVIGFILGLIGLPLLYFTFLLHDLFLMMLAAIILSVAAFTDFLDGWYARKHNQCTEIGTFIDPVRDKFLLVGVLAIASGSLNLWTFFLALIVLETLSAIFAWMLKKITGETKITRISKASSVLQAVFGLVLVTTTYTGSIGIASWAYGLMLVCSALRMASYLLSLEGGGAEKHKSLE